MKALLLAAGHGTRLRPLTAQLPKALVPVGGVPVLGHNLRLVPHHGIRTVGINMHAHPTAVRAYVGSGSQWNLHVTYSYEDRRLGTAGAIKRAASLLADAPFAVIYADNLSDCDRCALCPVHQRTGAVATLGLHVPHNRRASGIVEVEASGHVRSFVEKPAQDGTARGQWANTGVYILEPAVLDLIPPEVPSDFGHDLFPRLLAQGYPLYAAHVCTYYLVIDTPARYAAAQAHFAQRGCVMRPPWRGRRQSLVCMGARQQVALRTQAREPASVWMRRR